MFKKFLSSFEILPLFLISLGITTRFLFFWKPSFSGDEAFHVLKAVSVSRGIFDLIRLNNIHAALTNIFLPILEHNHPPAEFLILLPMVPFEPREFFVRFWYVLLSILVIFVSYLLLKKNHKQIALSFLVLITTSAYAIWWSQTAMYHSLALAAGIFISILILIFSKKPNGKNLLLLSFSSSLALLIFQDFIFYLPAIVWAVFENRSRLKLSQIFVSIAVYLLIACIFYIPYIAYAIFGDRFHAGFNYVLNDKLTGRVNVGGNIVGYWNNFFAYRGVFTIWPFALLAVFLGRKIKYSKYLFLTILIYLTVYIFKSVTPFHYFVSILGPLMLLASEWISRQRSYRIIIFVILTLNLLGLVPIFAGKNNPQIVGQDSYDQLKKVGDLAKRCLGGDDETYISTADAWRSAYYFGRRSQLEQDGTEKRIETINWFLEGKAENVKLIHFKTGEIGEIEEENLKHLAFSSIQYDRDKVYIFKNCQLSSI